MTITEAKARLSELVREVADHPVWLMRHSRPVAVVLSPGEYEALLDELEDLRDAVSVWESRNAPADLRIPIDRVAAELGLTQEASVS